MTFSSATLSDGSVYQLGELPTELCGKDVFEELWQLHPEDQPLLKMFGRLGPAKRWQKAYERDYEFNSVVALA